MKVLRTIIALISACLVVHLARQEYIHYETCRCGAATIQNSDDFVHAAVLYWISHSELNQRFFDLKVKKWQNVRIINVHHSWSYWYYSSIWSGAFELLPGGSQVFFIDMTECGKIIGFQQVT